MSRYITVLKLSNHGLNCIGKRVDVMYDKIRYDTELKEYVYGDDDEYTLSNIDVRPKTVEDLELIFDLSIEGFNQLHREFYKRTHTNIEDLVDDLNNIDITVFNNEQLEILEEYRKRVYDKNMQRLLDEYDNNFTLENRKLREEEKHIYDLCANPTGNIYYEEKGKLYMLDESKRKLIYDPKKPDKIHKEFIED